MSSTQTSVSSKGSSRPLTIGVFGGSFNPIHLGHALLAITTQQTKPVDKVVLVPVYKHAVKTDLLPFDDRVAMCKLAVAPFLADESNSKSSSSSMSTIEVSTVERDVGESNGAMLRGLKKQYPEGTRFLWICGDDFFRWMHRPKGLETLQEVSGLIVQRRLHKAVPEHSNDVTSEDRFFKEPIDNVKIRAIAEKMDLEIDFIYGELPHFSSTLVRRAPGHWRSFLPQAVSQYLDERPHLLQKLIANLDADAATEQTASTVASAPSEGATVAAEWVMRGLEAVHALQLERGGTGLRLSMGSERAAGLTEAQTNTDTFLRQVVSDDPLEEAVLLKEGFDEGLGLLAELRQIPIWLTRDRQVLEKKCQDLARMEGVEGWLARLALVEKFNSRVDVLIAATIRAITEIRESRTAPTTNAKKKSDDLPELLLKWCQGKEALGRLRAFVSAGGPSARETIRNSLQLRDRLNEKIATKERSIARVLFLQADMSSRLAAPEALHRMLEQVTVSEWSLMGCFSPSTPLPLVHKLLSIAASEPGTSSKQRSNFDAVQFFEASSLAIDFLLTFAKALAASGCTTRA